MLFFLYEYVRFHFVVNFYDLAYFPVIIDYDLLVKLRLEYFEGYMVFFNK